MEEKEFKPELWPSDEEQATINRTTEAANDGNGRLGKMSYALRRAITYTRKIQVEYGMIGGELFDERYGITEDETQKLKGSE